MELKSFIILSSVYFFCPFSCAILKSAVINLFICSLSFTGVLSPLRYLLITDWDNPAPVDNFLEEQFSSFKYLFKTYLNFIIHHSLWGYYTIIFI